MPRSPRSCAILRAILSRWSRNLERRSKFHLATCTSFKNTTARRGVQQPPTKKIEIAKDSGKTRAQDTLATRLKYLASTVREQRNGPSQISTPRTGSSVEQHATTRQGCVMCSIQGLATALRAVSGRVRVKCCRGGVRVRMLSDRRDCCAWPKLTPHRMHFETSHAFQMRPLVWKGWWRRRGFNIST